jgi:hypothetical protein
MMGDCIKIWKSGLGWVFQHVKFYQLACRDNDFSFEVDSVVHENCEHGKNVCLLCLLQFILLALLVI